MQNRKILKGYELRERVGAGGFGEVFRAYQPAVQREVAIKVILPQYANEPDFIRRFDVEAQLVARLEHPHIVPLYDYWRDPEGAYLVMRWLPKSLQKTIDHTPWSIADAARLLDQVAMGLSVAHRDHIIHRDLKPENILLDEDHNAYLADFGIAKDLGIEITSSNAGDISGSPAYLSPEQIRGEKVSPRSDIYSLGYVMYEVLIGEKAIRDATSLMHYLQHHLEHSLPTLSPQYSHIPAAIDEVLQTATAKIPEQRYASVERFAAAFRAALPTKLPRMHGQPLATPLTERELEVLRFIIEGLGNSQISDRLFLSPTTIKWYIRQIYSKLEVHSRHQAIARAQALNLFQAASPLTIPAPQNGNAKHEVLIDPVNPYKGLHAYQEADANDFFGRATLVEQLLNRLSEKREGRFLVVVGPSGSGKSSVIKAGLIPALRSGALAGSPRPFITEMFPGTHPLEELEAALLRVAANPFPGLLEQLQQDRRGLVRAVKRVLPGDDETELILVIDQFEELFTLVADEAMRVHFIDNLLSAATDPRSRIRIVLTLRADFYDRPLLYPRLAELVRSYTELVLPLSARELEQAMIGPAEQAGVQFEAGLIATILNDIGEQPGALPLLQYALTEIFERREGLTLTLDAYKAVGGVAGALARRADDLYLNLTSSEQAAVHQLFLRLVTPGEGTEDTRRRALHSELLSTTRETGMMEEVISTFSQYRLLTLDRDPITRGPTVEVAHEALIRQWERLREWLTHGREDIRVQRSLALSAADWEHARYDVSYLLRGTRLAQIEEWSSTTSLALTEAERTFLEASLAERKRQAVEEKERQEREVRLKQRSVLFLHSLLGVFVASTIIAVFLGSVAFSESRRANTALATEQEGRTIIEENVKELRELALVNGAQAAYVSNDLDTARALSLAANMGENPSNQSQLILANAAYAPSTVRMISDDHYDYDWYDATLSPDGHTLITMSGVGNRELVIWDLVLGEVASIFPVIPKDLTSAIAFRPTTGDQNLQLLTASEDGTMILWDFASQQPLRTFTHQAPVWNVAFSPDGEHIASGAEDNALRIWDTDSGALLHTLEKHSTAILALSFSPDGTRLLSASQDGSVVLWETATGRLIEQFDTNIQPSGLAFSADAKRFLVSSYAPFVMSLWDIDTRSEVRTFKRVGPIGSPYFSPDGQTVFAGEGNYVTFWDINTGEVTRTLTGHTFGGRVFPTNADATQLLTVARDGTIRQWDLRNGAEIAHTKSLLPNLLIDGEISPDGRTFAVAAGGFTVRPDLPGIVVLYDALTGAEIRRFGSGGVAHSGNTNSVRFSPDGQTLLSADWNGEIKLWDASDGSLLWDIQGIALAADDSDIKPDDSLAVNSVEFTSDGSALIASTDIGDVVWIDAATGEIIRRFPFDVPVRKAIFTRDGTRFLACLADASSSVVLVDVETGETRHQLLGQTQVCFALAVAPDDLTAVSGHVDGSIFLWDLTSGQLIRPFTGGLGKITELIFSNDGQTVYSGGFAGPAQASTVSFWDVATGELYRRLGGPNPTDALDLSTDGRTLLAGSYRGVALLWRIDDLPTLIEWTYANRYIRELTCTERELYRLEPLCGEHSDAVPE